MEWLIAIITGAIVQEGIKEVTQVTNGGTRMLGGLPVEMITMLGSSVLGGVMSIWSQSIKAKQDEQKMLLARADKQMSFVEKARTYENKDFSHFCSHRKIEKIDNILFCKSCKMTDGCNQFVFKSSIMCFVTIIIDVNPILMSF